MLYSSRYTNLKPDELRCDSNQLGLIVDYVKEHPETRVNIHWVDKDDLDKLKEQIKLLEKFAPNYTISCDKFAKVEECLRNSLNAYLNMVITDWETMDALIDWGVSDIWIDGPLCFYMDKMKQKKEEGNFLLRVRPYESLNCALSLSNNENSFFIRPEDTDIYEEYIDIFEFNGINRDQEEVRYTKYKNKMFQHDLSVLVTQLKSSTPNPYVGPDFAKRRLNCGQKCKLTSNCQLCKAYLSTTSEIVKFFQEHRKSID